MDIEDNMDNRRMDGSLRKYRKRYSEIGDRRRNSDDSDYDRI